MEEREYSATPSPNVGVTPMPDSGVTPMPMYDNTADISGGEAAAEDILGRARTGSIVGKQTQDVSMTSISGGNSTTTQKGIDVTGLSAYKDWQETNAKAELAYDQLREAHVKKSEAEFQGKQQLAELEAEQSALMKESEAIRQGKLAQTEAQVAEEMEKVANFEFKPWTEKGDNKMKSVVSLVLAGISQMLSHGSIGKNTGLTGPVSNNALDKQMVIIDKLKEDDMKLQKQEWEKAKTAVEQGKTRYGMLVNKYADERVAEAALRAQQSRSVQAQMEQKLAEYARNTGGGLDALKDKFNYLAFKQKAEQDRLNFELLAKDKITTTTEAPKVSLTTKTGEKDLLGTAKEASSLRGEYNTQVKSMREDLREAANVNAMFKEAANGNQAAIQQLSTMMTKLSQSGNFTEGDIKRSDANASLWQGFKGTLTKKVFGELSEHEKKTFKEFATAYKYQKQRELGQVAGNYIHLSDQVGIPAELVVIDKEEFNWATGGKDKKEGLNKYGATRVEVKK